MAHSLCDGEKQESSPSAPHTRPTRPATISAAQTIAATQINNRCRDLFCVQLEVTSKLLDAEKKKLAALQRDLDQHKKYAVKGTNALQFLQTEQLQTNICRIEYQCEQLLNEYHQKALGVLRKSANQSQSPRSQPAIGMKQTPKTRPSIFGTLTQDKHSFDSQKGVYPLMSHLSHILPMASHGFEKGMPHIDEQTALIFDNGNLMSGSIEALVQHLVPTAKYYPDRTYIFAFLLSSRLYIKPHSLLGQICQMCIFQQNLTQPDKVNKESLGKFGPYMVQLLSEWTEMFAYDFRDDRMMKHLKDMTQRIVITYPELRKDVGMLMHNLIAKLSSLQKYEELLTRINREVAQRLLNVLPTTDIFETCPEPLVLAQQLTHIELERLNMIGPEEFVQAFAKENEIESYIDMKKTNNLEVYVQWFNRLSYFVATEICMHLKKKNRVRMIEYFVDVAKECINIGNFNSLMAIIAGMNMSSIQRLKKTWAKVNTDKFEILEHQMNPSSNFSSYRSSLKAAQWRSLGAAEDREKIVIPFFSLFVKDIYFLNEGCASRMPNGLINFDKFWQLAKQITEFIGWKEVECPFDRHPAILNYILTNPVFSENSLALASFECEPPENHYEKERHKQLKTQAGL